MKNNTMISHSEYVYGLDKINTFFDNKEPSQFTGLKQSLLNDKTGKSCKVMNNRLVRSIAHQALSTTKVMRTRVLTEDSNIHHAGSTQYKGDNKFRDQLLVSAIIKARNLVRASDLRVA